jgi:ABC-type branched-subunit amino acid transport system ATPase component
MTVLLEADHLTCGYGKIVAVRDLDLQLVGGEVLAVRDSFLGSPVT